jgi:hypothetical protein
VVATVQRSGGAVRHAKATVSPREAAAVSHTALGGQVCAMPACLACRFALPPRATAARRWGASAVRAAHRGGAWPTAWPPAMPWAMPWGRGGALLSAASATCPCPANACCQANSSCVDMTGGTSLATTWPPGLPRIPI